MKTLILAAIIRPFIAPQNIWARNRNETKRPRRENRPYENKL